MSMKTVEMSNKELTYVLIALRKHEKELLAMKAEPMEDAGNDLIFIQALIERFKEAKARSV
jgi:hypothetical protein